MLPLAGRSHPESDQSVDIQVLDVGVEAKLAAAGWLHPVFPSPPRRGAGIPRQPAAVAAKRGRNGRSARHPTARRRAARSPPPLYTGVPGPIVSATLLSRMWRSRRLRGKPVTPAAEAQFDQPGFEFVPRNAVHAAFLTSCAEVSKKSYSVAPSVTTKRGWALRSRGCRPVGGQPQSALRAPPCGVQAYTGAAAGASCCDGRTWALSRYAAWQVGSGVHVDTNAFRNHLLAPCSPGVCGPVAGLAGSVR